LENNRLEALTDEQLMPIIRKGSEHAMDVLFERYKNYVRSKARSYFLIGADREDIIQEGMIGLYKAIRDYRDDKQSSFRGFAELCITRQMITAIKSATRQKHMPLNSYISLNKPVYDDGSDRTLIDVLTPAREANPEELMIGQEDFEAVEQCIGSQLTPLEKKSLMLYLRGNSYLEIAEELGKRPKSIDNALQRVKRKLETHLKNREK